MRAVRPGPCCPAHAARWHNRGAAEKQRTWCAGVVGTPQPQGWRGMGEEGQSCTRPFQAGAHLEPQQSRRARHSTLRAQWGSQCEGCSLVHTRRAARRACPRAAGHAAHSPVSAPQAQAQDPRPVLGGTHTNHEVVVLGGALAQDELAQRLQLQPAPQDALRCGGHASGMRTAATCSALGRAAARRGQDGPPDGTKPTRSRQASRARGPTPPCHSLQPCLCCHNYLRKSRLVHETSKGPAIQRIAVLYCNA